MFNNIRKSCYRVALLIVSFALLSQPLKAGPLHGVQAIKLLSAQTGWAANSDDLFWTTDAGAHWDERTPTTATKEAIEDVFFSGPLVGSVLLARGDGNDEVQFDLASTADAGKTWRVSHVEIPDGLTRDFSGHGSMYFLDSVHGWIDLVMNSGSAFRPGKMLYTENGGLSWHYAAGQPGVGGSFCFFNAQDGVLIGGPANSELYVTHDGSTSWQEVSLTASQALPADFATYSAPTCDGKNGFVPATFSGKEGTKAALVLFESNDAGHEFRPDRVLPNLDETSPGHGITTALTDSDLIALETSNATDLRLTTLPKNSNQMRVTSQVAGTPFAILKASFASKSQGWALTSRGLLLTTNGGSAWTDISPTGIRQAAISTTSTIATAPSTPNDSAHRTELTVGLPASPAVVKNTRLGFDVAFVPTTDEMNTWWQYSPYFESGLYLPGAVNKKKDPNLIPAWVSTVIGEGWGLIPIWVGPQAPCVISTKPLQLISVTNPYSQGQAEAAKAIAAAQMLSSSLGPIIYYNMEPYPTTVKQGCTIGAALNSKIVREFLNGWIQAIHSSNYKAGVYGAAPAAANDFSKLSPALPDDVWITAPPLPGQNPNVSIWGLRSTKTTLCDFFSSPPCATPLWYNRQRIHQYLTDVIDVWGGLAEQVDSNVVDADVSVSSTGAKPYIFQYISLDYPDATATQPLGVNNAGVVVGTYFDSAGLQHGFIYNNGAYSSFDYPGASFTEPYSVNDAGQIVGIYGNSGGFAGFLFSSGDYTSISLNNDFNRQPLAVNDDGLIIGNYGITAFFTQDLNNGDISTVACKICNASFVDGDAHVVGSQNKNNGTVASFLYNPISAAFTFIPLGVSDGVNDSLEMLGPNVLYDYSTNAQIPVQYPGTTQLQSYAAGINDYAEIVGTWVDSSFVTHGFLACPTGFASGCPPL